MFKSQTIIFRAAICLICLLFFGPSATSNDQDRLDATLEPEYGFAAFGNGGFESDYRTADMWVGGTVSISEFLPNYSQCAGFTGVAPNFRFSLSYTENTPSVMPLSFFFVSDKDTSIVVRAPDGLYYCNDDYSSTGLNPYVWFDTAQWGDYSIWIGKVGGSGYSAWGTLYVSSDLDYQPQYLPARMQPFYETYGTEVPYFNGLSYQWKEDGLWVWVDVSIYGDPNQEVILAMWLIDAASNRFLFNVSDNPRYVDSNGYITDWRRITPDQDRDLEAFLYVPLDSFNPGFYDIQFQIELQGTVPPVLMGQLISSPFTLKL